MNKTENNGYIRDIYNTTQRNYFDKNEPAMFQTNHTQPLSGILESSPLSELYFSKMNIEALQKTIRYHIYKLTQKKISYQSEIELFIIMRSMYLQFANSFVHGDGIVEAVKTLNEKVIDFSVSTIKDQLDQHDGYMKKISNAPTPMDHPQYVNKDNYTYDTSNIF